MTLHIFLETVKNSTAIIYLATSDSATELIETRSLKPCMVLLYLPHISQKVVCKGRAFTRPFRESVAEKGCLECTHQFPLPSLAAYQLF